MSSLWCASRRLRVRGQPVWRRLDGYQQAGIGEQGEGCPPSPVRALRSRSVADQWSRSLPVSRSKLGLRFQPLRATVAPEGSHNYLFDSESRRSLLGVLFLIRVGRRDAHFPNARLGHAAASIASHSMHGSQPPRLGIFMEAWVGSRADPSQRDRQTAEIYPGIWEHQHTIFPALTVFRPGHGQESSAP